MLYLHEKETGKRFSFSEEEVSELSAFTPDEAITSLGPAALDLCDEKYGDWKMILKSGRIFQAYGTTGEYDSVVRVMIRKKLDVQRGKYV